MTARRVRFPIGLSDFRNLRRDGFAYVDKSPLIDAVLDEDAQVLLVPRPRRFGKTLNLSMLRYFLEKSPEDRAPLFAGLAIASSEIARPHFQRYPVVFLTFKDVKPSSWEDCFAQMGDVLAGAYREHRYLQTEGKLAPSDAQPLHGHPRAPRHQVRARRRPQAPHPAARRAPWRAGRHPPRRVRLTHPRRIHQGLLR